MIKKHISIAFVCCCMVLFCGFSAKNEGKANDVLDTFIKINLPSDISLIKSDLKENYSTKKSNKSQSINDFIDTEVYSYKSESDE